MEYTINEFAKIANVTTRTLRFYDKINLLKPKRINSSGYRIYGEKEVDLLQQILIYRELGVNLIDIKSLIYNPSFDSLKALKEHQAKLLEKKSQLEILLKNVEKTIEEKEGRLIMADKEKFEGFKTKMIQDNELKYGKEARAKYGDEAVNKANQKLKNSTKEELDKINNLAVEIQRKLKIAFLTKDPSGKEAQEVADLHKQWLTFYWDSYSKEAHANIAKMYVQDPIFKAYYDKEQDGLAEFLRDAILIYTSK